MITLKGGFKTSDPRLDRLPEVDPRNANYPISAVVPEGVRSKRWRLTQRLDQGREGACVGFAWTHEIAAEPLRGKVDDAYARRVYREAQLVDEWPGEQYEGTSVLAGAKIVQGLGWMSEYRWAFTLEDILRALSHEGPVVMGTNWLSGMFNTDPAGFLNVSGSVAGGHAYVLRGLDVRKEFVVGRNSWGPDWGQRGDFYLRFSDLERLLGEGGDCCVPVGRRRPPAH